MTMAEEQISAKEFHDSPGTEGWHILYGGAHALYPTASFAAAVEFARAVADTAAEFGREPDLDVRAECVAVRTASDFRGRITTVDAALAARISALAAERGLEADDDRTQTVGIAVAQADGVDSRAFWLAALGYVYSSDAEVVAVDPLRRGPRIWFDEIAAPGRGRTHIDLAIANGAAQGRVDAALAAGGRLAIDSEIPYWWGLASPDNHSVDIAAWNDVNEEA
jgi:4a-hydroxytetrahydrobiopterin dehydratase